MNKSFHISIYTSFLIIITFFVVKVMLLSGFINSSVYTDWYEFISLLLFLPPFCIILKENIGNNSNFNSNMLDAINKSNSVIEFCPDGHVIKANQNFLDIFGYTIEEVKGKHHSMFVKHEYKNTLKYKKFWKDLRDGEFKSGEFVMLGSVTQTLFIDEPILIEVNLEGLSAAALQLK